MRIKHPDGEFLRANKTLAWASLLLLIRSGVLVGAGLVMVMSIMAFIQMLLDGLTIPGLNGSIRGLTLEEKLMSLLFVALPVIAGVLARLVLSHQPFLRVLTVMLVVVLAWVGFFELWMLVEWRNGSTQFTIQYEDLHSLLVGSPLFAALSFLVATMLCIVGMWIGGVVSRVARRRGNPGWRRKLKNARRRGSRFAHGV